MKITTSNNPPNPDNNYSASEKLQRMCAKFISANSDLTFNSALNYIHIENNVRCVTGWNYNQKWRIQ